MSRFKHIIDTPAPTTAETTSYTSQQSPNLANLPWPSSFPKSIIGLEYDGVINVDIGKPINSPDEWIPIEGSLEAIRTMRLKGYKVIILSDQGSIMNGNQTREQVGEFHQKAMQVFGENGIFSIEGFLYCILYAESNLKNDIYAKPNIGMFEKAEKEIFKNLRFKQGGYYVGHRMKDLKAAMRIGAQPILVRTGQGMQTEEALKKYSAEKVRKKTKTFNNLLQFANSLK